jgi:hypothetical protein
MSNHVAEFMAGVQAKNPAQPEFIQAVEEVVTSLMPVMDRHPQYREGKGSGPYCRTRACYHVPRSLG